MENTTVLGNRPGQDYGTFYNGVDISKLSDSDFSNYLANQQKINSRYQQLTRVNLNQGSGSNNSSNNSGSSSSDLLGGLGSSGLADYTSQAKDLATFNLNNAEQQSSYDAGLRNTEYNQDNARQIQLNDSTYGWQQKINNDTQGALSQRLNAQLQNNTDLQNSQFAQQNNTIGRAVSLASTRLGG
jgi:hypothetical protein